MKTRNRNLLTKIQLFVLLISMAIIIGVAGASLAIVTYTMIKDLRTRSMVTADEMASLMEHPLYAVDEAQAVLIGETFLSSKKINSIALESTANGVILSKRLGKPSPWIEKISRDIYRNGMLLGRFTVTFSDEEVRRTQKSFGLIAIAILVAVFLANLLANRFILARRVMRIFAPITLAIEKIADGNYETQIQKTPYRDVNLLVSIVNEMAGKILKKNEERVIAERNLRESERKARAVFDLSIGFVGLLTPDGRVVDINRTALNFFGIEQAEVQDKHFWATPWWAHSADMQAQLKEAVQTAAGGELVHFETVHYDQNGKQYNIDFSLKPIRDEMGQVVWLIPEGRDITERRKMEQERDVLNKRLLQSQKMEAIGQLAGGIAHDFNNILAGIIGYTELLQMKLPSPGPEYDYTHQILQAGNRAKDLVQQILAFSRQTKKELKPIEVNIIIKEVTKLLRSSLPTTIQIEQNLRGNPLVMGDSTQIHQMLMNLCTNAGHAMQENGGILSIDVQNLEISGSMQKEGSKLASGSYVQISVSDTGHGIPADLTDRVFDPFFTTKKRGEGTGMGLSVVHGIIKSYDGEITLHSKAGEGTTATILLPAIDKISKMDAIEVDDFPRGGEHILLVDDEPMLVEVGASLLESLGYKVSSRTNSLEALDFFKSDASTINLVITDMTMPAMTGDELAKEIKLIEPAVPIILCTGFSSKLTSENAHKYNVDALLLKPIILREMAKVVRNTLDGTK